MTRSVGYLARCFRVEEVTQLFIVDFNVLNPKIVLLALLVALHLVENRPYDLHNHRIITMPSTRIRN